MRRIQSFVCRAGRKSKTQTYAWDTLWPLYGLSAAPNNPGSPNPECLIQLDTVFGRSAETVLEIGFGDGRSLAQMAKSAPEKNFIGIEVYRAGIGSLLAAIEHEKLSNVRIVCADALEVLERISDDSLTTVQLFFADPWPKTKHHKRRLVQPSFVNLVAKKLKIDGTLHMATDWEAYAEHMMAVVTASPQFANVAGEGRFIERPAFRPLTKYEHRGLRLGHKSWDLIFQRGGL